MLGAIAFGLAYPWLEGINLSWLAWGALVPLFVALRPVTAFWPFAARVYGFFGLATLFYCVGWYVGVPGLYKIGTALIGLVQILLQGLPLLALFLLKRRVSYEQALLALVVLVPLVDGLLHFFPFASNMILLGYTQGANVWLIQYADLFGVGAITAWVVLFNVLLYRAWVAAHEKRSKVFLLRAVRVAAVLLLVPLGYAALRQATLAPTGETVRITLVSTNVPPTWTSIEQRTRQVERAVTQTDALEARRGTAPRPDLYAWYESALTFDWDYNNLRAFLYAAVDDWQTPLLTGAALRTARPGPTADASPDTVAVNQAVLIHPGGGRGRPVHTYDKIRPMPLQEYLPGYGFLQRFASVRAYHEARNLLTPGEAVSLLPLETRDGRTVQLGTPICHEGNFPALWAAMARDGAEVFVQLNFESWFGDLGFQHLLTNITRVRAIETRRSVARSANGGPSLFFDAFGRSFAPAPRPVSSTTAAVPIYAGTTLHTRFPALFPLLCLLALAGLLLRASRHRPVIHDA